MKYATFTLFRFRNRAICTLFWTRFSTVQSLRGGVTPFGIALRNRRSCASPSRPTAVCPTRPGPGPARRPGRRLSPRSSRLRGGGRPILRSIRLPVNRQLQPPRAPILESLFAVSQLLYIQRAAACELTSSFLCNRKELALDSNTSHCRYACGSRQAINACHCLRRTKPRIIVCAADSAASARCSL